MSPAFVRLIWPRSIVDRRERVWLPSRGHCLCGAADGQSTCFQSAPGCQVPTCWHYPSALGDGDARAFALTPIHTRRGSPEQIHSLTAQMLHHIQRFSMILLRKTAQKSHVFIKRSQQCLRMCSKTPVKWWNDLNCFTFILQLKMTHFCSAHHILLLKLLQVH